MKSNNLLIARHHRLTDTLASFWYQTTGTSLCYQFLVCVSPALYII